MLDNRCSFFYHQSSSVVGSLTVHRSEFCRQSVAHSESRRSRMLVPWEMAAIRRDPSRKTGGMGEGSTRLCERQSFSLLGQGLLLRHRLLLCGNASPRLRLLVSVQLRLVLA